MRYGCKYIRKYNHYILLYFFMRKNRANDPTIFLAISFRRNRAL